MRQVSTWSRLLFTSCFCAVTVGAHAEDLLSKVRQDKELVIGTEMQYAPFDFIENGEQRGFNKELFAEVGKDLGVKVRFVDLPWESVLPGLDADKFELVAGPVTITKARMERYAYTLPIAQATVAFMKSAGDHSIQRPSDVAGKPVAAQRGSSQDDQLKQYLGTLPTHSDVHEYVDNNQAYADLAAGRVAAVANSLPNIAYAAKLRPEAFAVVLPAFGAPSYFAYVARKDADSKPLVDAVDQTILKMRADGRLATLQKRWFGLTMDTPATIPIPNL